MAEVAKGLLFSEINKKNCTNHSLCSVWIFWLRAESQTTCWYRQWCVCERGTLYHIPIEQQSWLVSVLVPGSDCSHFPSWSFLCRSSVCFDEMIFIKDCLLRKHERFREGGGERERLDWGDKNASSEEHWSKKEWKWAKTVSHLDTWKCCTETCLRRWGEAYWLPWSHTAGAPLDFSFWILLHKKSWPGSEISGLEVFFFLIHSKYCNSSSLIPESQFWFSNDLGARDLSVLWMPGDSWC